MHATSFHIQMLLFKATLETCRRDLFVCFACVHGEVWLIFNELCFSLFFLSLLYLLKYKGVISFTFCIQFDFHSFDCYLFCFFFLISSLIIWFHLIFLISNLIIIFLLLFSFFLFLIEFYFLFYFKLFLYQI